MNHSTIDLANREDCAYWMNRAATFESGENEGEYLKLLDPSYWKARERAREPIEKAKKKGGQK